MSSATSDALARARRAAAERGLRPGMVPMRRRGAAAARPGATSPGGRSGAGGRDGRDPVTLGDELEKLLVQHGWTADVAAGSVVGRWEQVVGERVAAHTHPVGFDAGVLTVQADSTAWATNLRMMASTIVATIGEQVGPDVVAEIRVLGPTAPSWSKGRLRATDGRGPRDTYG